MISKNCLPTPHKSKPARFIGNSFVRMFDCSNVRLFSPKSIIFLTLLFLTASLPLQAANLANKNFSPFIQQFKNGWIDWDNGLIYGVGNGYLDNNHKVKGRAKRAASLVAFGNIMKIAADLHLEDASVRQALGAGKVTIKLRAMIKAKEQSSKFTETSSRPHFRVVQVAAMKGIEGLSGQLIKEMNSTKWRTLTPPRQNTVPDDDDLPWLILDARSLGYSETINPALFPKIKDSSGNTIYSLDTVEKDSAVNKGMARYVVVNPLLGESGSQLDENGAFWQQIISLFEITEAQARQKKRRKRRNYIVKKVINTSGLAKTNLVISATDARQLKAEDSSTAILKKCRVIVVVDSTIGGIQGQLDTKSAFFAYVK